jgi:NhaP-type Na+/H+ and K+/H+ antiporter
MVLAVVFGAALLVAVLLCLLGLIHITSPKTKASFEPLGQAPAELAKFTALLVFGALSAPRLFGDLSWGGCAAVVLAIFLILPALLLSLFGTRISRTERSVAAWFGPRGFASVAYGLLVLRSGIRQAEEAFTLVAVCVAFAIRSEAPQPLGGTGGT